MTSTERTEAPLRVGEQETLLAWLNYHRDTLRQKSEGLTGDQLSATLPPSTMTLGGLLKHMALVEDYWFSVVLMGNEDAEPWQGVDFDADPDWEWRTAADDSPEELRRLFDDACAASDRILERVLAEGDQRARKVMTNALMGGTLLALLIGVIALAGGPGLYGTWSSIFGSAEGGSRAAASISASP